MIPSYPPTKAYTGPPASLHRLCRELISLGVEVKVATTNDDGPARLPVEPNRWGTYEGVPVFYGDRIGPRGDVSPALHRCIREEAARAELVHVAPVFSWPTLSASRACRRAGRPIVVSPRGSLAPQALAWRPWKKAIFMALGGRRALHEVNAFHATTTSEARDIASSFAKAVAGVVPNGVEVPPKHALDRWRGTGAGRTILYLGRLHPHKNLDVLIAAWARVATRFPDSRLVLAGPGEARTLAGLKRLAVESGVEGQVHFAGLVQGEAKSQLLAQSVVLVLPSKSENFGNAVAEALAHATPAIASIGTPWEDLATHRCGWWIEAAAAPLAHAIETALTLKRAELCAMGRAGREWMIRDFSWPSVASRMRDFYGEVIERNAAR